MSPAAPARPHLLARLLAVLAAVSLAGLALLAGAPAGAHGGDGQMEVTALERDGDDVAITVHLSYVADGHGVPDATVTVVVDDATPVPMTAGTAEGDYVATLAAAPGAAIRITSVEPPVALDATAPDADATTTTSTTAASDTTDAPSTTDASDTTEATTSTTDDVTTTSTTATDDDADDEGGNGLVIGGLIALVVVAAAVVAVVVLRKPTPDADS